MKSRHDGVVRGYMACRPFMKLSHKLAIGSDIKIIIALSLQLIQFYSYPIYYELQAFNFASLICTCLNKPV